MSAVHTTKRQAIVVLTTQTSKKVAQTPLEELHQVVNQSCQCLLGQQGCY